MTASEQARADADVFRCLTCEMDISRKTRWFHQHEGHLTVGPVARDSDQARFDADADAETLRLNDDRLDWIGMTRSALASGQDITAVEIAVEDARAAFRACPLLRGE